MTAADKPTLEVGQEVWLYAQRSQPKRGTITKIGRALVTIREGARSWESKYRIDGGRLNSQFSNGSYFLTDDQRAERDRRAEVVAALSEHGIELRMGRSVPLDKLERILAAVSS